MCEAAKQASVVRIQPIVAHLAAGDAIREAGVGGGGEDLERGVDLNLLPPQDLHALLDMCVTLIQLDSTRVNANLLMQDLLLKQCR